LAWQAGTRRFEKRRSFQPDYAHRVWCNCAMCRSRFRSMRYEGPRWPVMMSTLGVERADGTFFTLWRHGDIDG